MKNLWEEVGGILLCIIIWSSVLFPETLFGVEYKALSNIIVGLCALMFLTLKPYTWFGIKGLREWTWIILGGVNIILGISLLW